jgi:hypothetical protein
LTYDCLGAIKPEEWTNVGPSVIHGFNILLQQQTTSCQNICSLKSLMDTFVKKTLDFIKNQEAELMGMKN